MPDVEITELEEFEPSRVDGVGKGANGFPILLMKSLPQVPDEPGGVELEKTDGGSCDTCGGSGKIRDGHVTCPDCDGSGKTASDAEKAELDAKARNSLDNSDFAYVDSDGEGHLPINDAAHVRAALGRFGQTEFDKPGDKKAAAEKIIAAAKKFDIDVADDTDVTAAAKAVSGDNPLYGTPVPAAQPDASVPGSATWEASDADTAAQAAAALMQAADLIRTFAAREGAEVAAGEGSDLIDEFDALVALDAVTCALGTMARLAFLEGASAQKSEGDGAAAKAGKVLSAKSVDAIRAAIKALNDLLASAAGGSQTTDGEDAAEKAQGDILAMTKDELAAFLDERDTAKTEARKQAKAEAKQARDQEKAAKAEKRASETPEETEARKQAKADKREAKKAAKAEKEATKAEQTATAVVEKMDGALKTVTEQVDALKADLESVKKMAAPGGPVKTRTPDAVNKSEKRDALELEIADMERRANLTTESELRKGYMERAKAARAQLAQLAA